MMSKMDVLWTGPLFDTRQDRGKRGRPPITIQNLVSVLLLFLIHIKCDDFVRSTGLTQLQSGLLLVSVSIGKNFEQITRDNFL